MPHFEDEPKMAEPKEIWLISYADLVTLMMAFFILLFSFCKLDVTTMKVVAGSFKPTPPGTPFLLQGGESVFENAVGQLEGGDIGDQAFVTMDERGVVVEFTDVSLFRSGGAELLPEGEKSLARFAKFLHAFPNRIAVEGHTDDLPIRSALFPSNWELSGARAGAVARLLEREGISPGRLEIIGYGSTHPRFLNDSDEKRALNRRVEVVLKPD